MNRTRILAVLVFDEVEVLDFCGPFEVFSVANLFRLFRCRSHIDVAPFFPSHRCSLSSKSAILPSLSKHIEKLVAASLLWLKPRIVSDGLHALIYRHVREQFDPLAGVPHKRQVEATVPDILHAGKF